MSKKFLHKLILIFSGSALALSLFFGLFTSSANYFVINVNQAEDLALAKDAVVCDTNLIDFESTCSLRAAIEFAHVMKAQDPTIADYIIIKFEDLLTKGIDTIELSSKLPTIKIPIIIDGGNTDCANSNLKSKPRLTISGKGSYSYGFSFDSFYGTSQDSAHGSKVCNIALDGFNSGGISINGYWDYTNLVFKDAKLNTTYEFFNNYIGFDKSGTSFNSSSTSSGNVNISSTQGVLLKNNVIRSTVSSYNSNNLDFVGNLIGVNANAMPVSTHPTTSISLTHNSNQDDGTVDNVNIVENLFVNISSSASFNNLKFSDNIIGFSPYSESGVQKFMNLTSSSTPVYLYGSLIKNLTFTNNNVDFGSADSGYAFEPKPSYIDYLISLPVVENMYFDNNKIGTQIGFPDSYYATALYF